MKILFILEYYYPYIGGSEKLFQSLAESLAKNNQVTILTTKFESSLPKNETKNGVEIIRINCKNRFLFTLYALPYLFRIISKFDIIHTTTYTAALPTWIACILFRKKRILTFHEYWNRLWFTLPYLSTWERWGYYFFEKLIYKLPFDKVVAVSDFTKTELIRKGKKKENIQRIYNGLDYSNYKKKNNLQQSQKFTCTYFGRLGVSKGLDILIPSIKKHIEQHAESQFNLIIPNVPEKMYHIILNELKKINPKNINLYHNLEKEKLFQIIQSSSCVVIPSYSEGFCFSAVESIALGVPIIHSNQGALRETVSGKQIRIKNLNTEGLTKALDKAINEQWEETPFRPFPLQASVDAYIDLYQSI